MKLQNLFLGAVLAFMMLIATRANAAAVNLTCTLVDTPTSSAQLTFDEEQRTVLFGTHPTAAATFTATDITWETPSGDVDPAHRAPFEFDLNRMTGVLKMSYYESNGRNWFTQVTSYNCAVAQR